MTMTHFQTKCITDLVFQYNLYSWSSCGGHHRHHGSNAQGAHIMVKGMCYKLHRTTLLNEQNVLLVCCFFISYIELLPVAQKFEQAPGEKSPTLSFDTQIKMDISAVL